MLNSGYSVDKMANVILLHMYLTQVALVFMMHQSHDLMVI